MKLSWTLSWYLARQYALSFLILTVGLMGIIYFFDTVELLRRASKFSDVPLTLVLQMGLLKLPEVTQVILPFAVLFSSIYTFWHLTQKLELIIVRSAGFSSFHFLTPVISTVIAIGLIYITILNPLGALMLKQYEKLENVHLKRNTNNIALFEDGLWLKQTTSDGYVILHSQKVNTLEWTLSGVTSLFFDTSNHLIMRLDAPTSRLQNGQWLFENAVLHHGFNEKEQQQSYALPTDLTPGDVVESFASPETVSFWKLPAHIEMIESSGFNPSRMQVYYHSLLSLPLLFVAMVFIAAGVAMRLPRSGAALRFIIAGLLAGLIIFFFTNFMQALGSSQQIPVILASWAPTILSLMMGISLVLHLEEE